MQRGGNAAKVVAVGHDEQGQQANGSMLKGVDGAHVVQKAFFQRGADAVWYDIPQTIGFKNLRRRGKRREGTDSVKGR